MILTFGFPNNFDILQLQQIPHAAETSSKNPKLRASHFPPLTKNDRIKTTPNKVFVKRSSGLIMLTLKFHFI